MALMERRTVAAEEVRIGGRTFPTTGGRAIHFIEQHCYLTKGQWRGEPFKLFAWQKKFIYQLFEIDPDTGRRRYRWAYLEVPKKNGKSELMAALNVYLLMADDEASPEIACGSNSEEQADLVFGAAKAMIEMSPTLTGQVSCFRKELVRKDNPAAKIIRVSAKAKTNDGRNLSTVCLDELHEFDASGEQLFNVLTNGLAAREQPLALMITTAGWDMDTLCGRFHQHALKVIGGEEPDPAFFATVYAAPDPDVDIADDAAYERALRAANPSMGELVDLPFYLDERRKGADNAKRYYLDIWTSAATSWLPAGAWDECAGTANLVPGAPTWAGIDASTARDSTAIVVGQRDGEVVRVLAKIWERPIEPATGKPQEGWRVPLVEIEEYIRQLGHTYDMRGIGFDPWNMMWMAQRLQQEGVPMVEVPQTPARVIPATQAAYELVLDRNLVHDGDPTFARHIRNAMPKRVEGGYRLVKHLGRANDAASALVTMLVELPKPQEAPKVAQIFLPDDDDDEVA